jgi:hypothetical protein
VRRSHRRRCRLLCTVLLGCDGVDGKLRTPNSTFRRRTLATHPSEFSFECVNCAEDGSADVTGSTRNFASFTRIFTSFNRIGTSSTRFYTSFTRIHTSSTRIQTGFTRTHTCFTRIPTSFTRIRTSSTLFLTNFANLLTTDKFLQNIHIKFSYQSGATRASLEACDE